MKFRIRFADLSRQHEPLRAEIEKAVASVMREGDFILGKEVTRFEEEFAEYCGVKCAVGVDSGSSALELSLRAIGIGPGSEVIVPAFSFVATAWAVRAVGAKPIFVDVDPESMVMDLGQCVSAVNERTRAVIPVHLYGYPIALEPFKEKLPAGCAILEDACQAHGARLATCAAGAAGRAGAFSFYPSKNLGGIGDGGMVITGDENLAAEIRSLRNYGRDRDGRHTRPAVNRRLDTIQAAVLRVKLKHLDEWNSQRREAAAAYRRELSGSELVLPPEPAIGTHCYHTFTVRSPKRNELAGHLGLQGIETRIHYEEALSRVPILRDNEAVSRPFPVAERLAREVLSLPVFPGIRPEEIREVASSVLEFSSAARR